MTRICATEPTLGAAVHDDTEGYPIERAELLVSPGKSFSYMR